MLAMLTLTALLVSTPLPGLETDSVDLAAGQITRIVLPDGSDWPLTVLRSEAQPSGMQVWTARLGGEGSPHRMIVTRGPDAAFAWISTPDGNWQIAPSSPGGPMEITPVRLADIGPASDVLTPPRAGVVPDLPGVEFDTAAEPGEAERIVDIAVVYTDGMESYYGLAVITRAQHLINVLDQALIDSDAGVRARMVHAQHVGVPWNEFTSTLETIDDLVAGASFGNAGTSADVFGSCSGANGLQCNNDGDLSHLFAMRNAKSADIVIMLRRYWRQQQTYCGVAYLPGGDAEGVIDPAEDNVYGVAVTGDGPDGNGTGWSCGDLTFAHEIGHNLGSHHNVENTSGPGLFTYSYGHRVDCQFRTIMAYDSTRSGVNCGGFGQNESWAAAFSNPNRFNCFGQACGIAADDNTTPADNARSIRTEGWRVMLYRDPPAPRVVSAVLPSSRAVAVGEPATAFVTIVNPVSTGSTALGCGLELHGGNSGGSFTYRTTDPATNAATGEADTPADIPAGGSQSYVFAVTRDSVLFQSDLRIVAACENRLAQAAISGLNTLLFSATSVAGPDIVSLAATPAPGGVLTIPEAGQTRAFAVAIANAGASGSIRFLAGAMPGAEGIGTIEICQTDPQTGQCLTPRLSSVNLTVGADETATFSVFVTALGAIANDPATNRVRFRALTSGSNVTVGSTSVAVRTE